MQHAQSIVGCWALGPTVVNSITGLAILMVGSTVWFVVDLEVVAVVVEVCGQLA